jgi:flagellar motor switch protein FliG
MPARNIDIPGVERAAILLMSLGEADAAAILKHLDTHEVEAIGVAMAKMTSVPQEKMTSVLDSFMARADSGAVFGSNSHDFMKSVLTSVFGKQRAELVLERILSGSADGGGIEALEEMDARAIAQIIGEEHPQIIASLLAHLEASVAAKVVAQLPQPQRADILMRIARLESLPQGAMAELDRIVADRLATAGQPTSRKIGGASTVADIVNAMDRDSSDEILQRIESEDGPLHSEIKDFLFVFDDLLEVDSKGLQAILREVSSGILATALRGADARVAEKIFGNMSKRAADILKEDVEARGPIRVSEVEAAQREIINVALKLAQEGAIVLAANSTEYV